MSSLRSRKERGATGKRGKRRDVTDSQKSKPKSAVETTAEDPETVELRERMNTLKHLALITVIICSPYVGKLAYNYYHFQSGITRPVVSPADERQVTATGLSESHASEALLPTELFTFAIAILLQL